MNHRVEEPVARYLAVLEPPLLRSFDLLAGAPKGVARLRELILSLAVRGKLVSQDPSDEPASVLLERIRVEKARLVAEGKIRREKVLVEISGEEKPFEVPGGWEWVRLSELLPEFQNGASSRGEHDGVPVTVLRLADIKTRRISLEDTREIPIKGANINKYRLANGDILIVRVNGSADIVGNFILNEHDIPAIHCDHFIRMRIDRRWMNPRYMALLGQTRLVRDRISSLFITTAGQKTVNQGHIGSLFIALPPLAEQSRIVARVEALMRLCDELEAKGRLEAEQHARLVGTLYETLAASESAHALAENWQRIAEHFDLLLDRPETVDALEQTLLQLAVRGLLVPQDPADEPASTLLETIRAEKHRLIAAGKLKRDKPLPPITEDEKPFELPEGWEWARVLEVTDISGGIQKTPARTPQYSHYPYLRVANVQRGRLILDEIERFELRPEELTRWRLQSGDLLVIEGNGSEHEIGRCAVWRGEIEDCVHQNHLIRVRPIVMGMENFLLLFLNSEYGRAEMKRLAITTSGLFSLSVGKIASIAFPLPPLPEQSRIVARAEQLRRLCADLRARLGEAHTTQSRLAESLVSLEVHA